MLTHKYSSYQLVWLTPENLDNGDRRLLIISTKSSDAYYTIVSVTQTSDDIKINTADDGSAIMQPIVDAADVPPFI